MTTRSTTSIPQSPPRPPPVLVVDDDVSGARATLLSLDDGGYATTAESDGDAVLRLVRREAMRLVVSELYIACSEGACVVQALKADRVRLPRLRVLAHSRHTAPADDAWALAAGCDAVLHKPAATRSLLREVRRLDGGERTDAGDLADDGVQGD